MLAAMKGCTSRREHDQVIQVPSLPQVKQYMIMNDRSIYTRTPLGERSVDRDVGFYEQKQLLAKKAR
jgi:hypothetical protein